MRLSKIKMAGFKSFVDPTTIQFPSDMVGVVGPNGCGKSNVIDAVRFVMGESSKHLRGDTMEDVIFNGSSARKPVGQASIELVFDNSDSSSVGGQYAHYNEISIRRQVSRDGQSKYFLNGAKCRRKDITDIFLGTGLGPRSYAIIEQGMISRLIEAKPEELRVFLEEAAGISKYKERRRETENRIRHTRDNLDRLNDLLEEIEKQLNRLQRQAKTAERYKVLKQEERQAKAELLALRWRSFDQELTQREYGLKEHETRLEQMIAELRTDEARIEKQRSERVEASEAFNEVQAQYYQIGGEISRVESAIQHAKALRERQQEEAEQTQMGHKQAHAELACEREHIQKLSDDLERLEPRLETAQTEQHQSTDALSKLEQTQASWQHQWDDLSRRLSEPTQTAQVERARMEHLEQQLVRSQQRQQRLIEEQSQLSISHLETEAEQLESQLADMRSKAEQCQQALRYTLDTLRSQRDQNQELGSQLDEARGNAHDARGRLASLEALQEAALGKHQQGVTQWLVEQQLDTAPRLAQQVDVEPGWEQAVETVLGPHLEAVCVEGIDSVSCVLDTLEQGHLIMMDISTVAQGDFETVNGYDLLVDKIKGPALLRMVLNGIYIADNTELALGMRNSLPNGESIITKEGLWFSHHWLRVSKDSDEHAGILERETAINELKSVFDIANDKIEAIQQMLEQGKEALLQLEQDRERTQNDANQAHRSLTEIDSKLDQRHSKLAQAKARRAQLSLELQEIQKQIDQDQDELKLAGVRRTDALEKMNLLGAESDLLQRERTQINSTLSDIRGEAQQHSDAAHEIALRIESLRTARISAQQNIDRMEAQLTVLSERIDTLKSTLEAGVEPLLEQEHELKIFLERRVMIEQLLNDARNRVQSIEADMRECEQQRTTVEHRIDALRNETDQLRMAWQESRVRRDTVKEQIDESGFLLEEVLREIKGDANIQEWEQQVESLERKIGRLGPINLAAIDEFKEESERKEYLDSQHADLTEALATLETAIQKIDHETKQRFKDTFERVNTRLQETFPRLFGGGHAHLEMTGDDLLSTGISILARPPGKRISTIHLMSGGEKALTAVALVFSLFELNPAPFCMLDEVDAPLDDYNVGRFCELVKEMSERVQFIYITHNKITMEYAEQLVGVTMHEPGVSRLVAVDVEEAAKMATG